MKYTNIWNFQVRCYIAFESFTDRMGYLVSFQFGDHGNTNDCESEERGENIHEKESLLSQPDYVKNGM